MVLTNTIIFEMTGEFFSKVRYGAVVAAFMRLTCALADQSANEQDYVQGYLEDYDDYEVFVSESGEEDIGLS